VNKEQSLEIRRLTTIVEAEREDRNKLYQQNQVLIRNQQMTMKTQETMFKQMQKLLAWQRVPQTPTPSSDTSTPRGKRPHDKSPSEAGATSAPAPNSKRRRDKSPARDANAQVPALAPMEPATAGVAAAAVGLAGNFNDVDTGDTHGGTNIEDIIISAHPFRGGVVSLSTVVKPGRFSDNAKFYHCADLIDVVITDEQKAALLKESATKKDVMDLANDISKACMKQLNVWDLKLKARPGYTGVGARVQKIKAWNPDLDVNKLVPDKSDETQLSQAAKDLKAAASQPGQQTLSFQKK